MKYLIETIEMCEEDADLFLSGFEIVNYSKGQYLLKEGNKSNVVRILLKGCACGFVVIEGKEITTNFYFENDHTYDHMKYLLQQLAGINIQALDDISAIEMTMEAIEFLNSEILGFHKMSFNLFNRFNWFRLTSVSKRILQNVVVNY